MKATRYITEIVRQYPDENPEDFVMMIEILAEERAKALETELSDEMFEFAGKILCNILDPVKLQGYREKVKFIRLSYKGIAESHQMQNLYRTSLTSKLLKAATPQEAILAGVEALFLIPVDA